ISNYYTKSQTDSAISSSAAGLTQSFNSSLNLKADQSDLDTTNQNVTAAQNAADDAQDTADSKLDASAINNYYTKTETDGQINTAKSGLTQTFNAAIGDVSDDISDLSDAFNAKDTTSWDPTFANGLKNWTESGDYATGPSLSGSDFSIVQNGING